MTELAPVPISALPRVIALTAGSLVPALQDGVTVGITVENLLSALGGGYTLSNWETAHDYGSGQMVLQGNNMYIASVEHTSGVFADDLADGKWDLLWNLSSIFENAEDAADAAIASAASAAAAAQSAQDAADAAVGGGLADGDRGDITLSSTGAVWTIDPNAVNNAKLAQMAAGTVKANLTGAPADPTDSTLAALKTAMPYSKADVGLGNVDNTSDVNKPVSTAQATAIAAAISAIPAQTAATENYTPAGTGAVTRTTANKLGEWRSVKDFGALGNDAADDVAAINLCCAAVAAAGGGIAWVPAGIYRVGISSGSLGVVVPTGVILAGESRWNTVIKSKPNTTVHPVTIGTAGNEVSEVGIQDICIDGNRANQTNRNTAGIRIGGAERIFASRLWIKGTTTYGLSVSVGYGKKYIIDDLVIEDTGWDGIDFHNQNDDNEATVISNIVIRGFGQDTLDSGKAGIDCRGPVNLSNITIEDFGPAASGVGVRFRQGEVAGGGNGVGGHYSTLTNFRIHPGGASANSIGVSSIAYRVAISNGVIVGGTTGLRLFQKDHSVSNVIIVEAAGVAFDTQPGVSTPVSETVSDGEWNTFIGCQSIGAGTYGFRFEFDYNRAIGCRSTGSGTKDFRIEAGAVGCRIVEWLSTTNTTADIQDLGTSSYVAPFTPSAGGGDVVGPAASTNSNFAMFNGGTGKLLKDNGLALDVDGTLAANSDTKIPSQKGVKTYVDAAIAAVRNGVSASFDTLAEIATWIAATGTMAQQNANSVNITGGAISGITDLPVADGGTGASNATNARSNLGLVIGTNVQAQDATLQSLAALGTAADKLPYTTGVDTWAETAFTALGRTLAAVANAAAIRTAAGLVIDTDVPSFTPVAAYTPVVTLVGGAGNTVPVYTNNVGRWQKIGKRVFVDINLNGDGGAEGAGTGTMNISLPAAAGASAAGGAIAIGTAQNGTTEYQMYGAIGAGASVIVMSYFDLITNRSTFTGALQNNTSREICLSFSYECA